jgi:hypothetical protein
MRGKQGGRADAVKRLVMQQGFRFLVGHGLCHYNRTSFRTSMTTPPKGDTTEGLYGTVRAQRASLTPPVPSTAGVCMHGTSPPSHTAFLFITFATAFRSATGKAEVTINGNCEKVISHFLHWFLTHAYQMNENKMWAIRSGHCKFIKRSLYCVTHIVPLRFLLVTYIYIYIYILSI